MEAYSYCHSNGNRSWLEYCMELSLRRSASPEQMLAALNGPDPHDMQTFIDLIRSENAEGVQLVYGCIIKHSTSGGFPSSHRICRSLCAQPSLVKQCGEFWIQ